MEFTTSDLQTASESDTTYKENLIKVVLENIRGRPNFASSSYYREKIDITKIHELTRLCQQDQLFLLEVTKRMIYDVATLTNICHSTHRLDQACLQLLTLMVSTEEGCLYFTNRKDILLNWQRYCIYIGWKQAFTPFILQYESSEKEYQEKELKKCLETPEIEICLNLANCGMGILLDTKWNRSAPSSIIRRKIQALPKLYQELSRKEFCGIFPKGCPGCIGLNLVCAAELLDNSRLICQVVSKLLNDPRHEIFTEAEVDMCRILSRRFYRRSDDHKYPFMGNCLDFLDGRDLLKVMENLGNLIQSPLFSSRMVTHRAQCLQFVRDLAMEVQSMSVDEFCNSLT